MNKEKDLSKIRIKRIKPPCQNCGNTKYRKKLWTTFYDPTWIFCSDTCIFEYADKVKLLVDGEPLDVLVNTKTKQTITRKEIMQ